MKKLLLGLGLAGSALSSSAMNSQVSAVQNNQPGSNSHIQHDIANWECSSFAFVKFKADYLNLPETISESFDFKEFYDLVNLMVEKKGVFSSMSESDKIVVSKASDIRRALVSKNGNVKDLYTNGVPTHVLKDNFKTYYPQIKALSADIISHLPY